MKIGDKVRTIHSRFPGTYTIIRRNLHWNRRLWYITGSNIRQSEWPRGMPFYESDLIPLEKK